MGTPSAGRLHRKSCQQGCTGLFAKMSPHCLLASLLLLPAASQAATQERGLFGDVLGGILGGANATAAETATDAATDAAPSDIVGTLMQVIPAILASNGSLPICCHRCCTFGYCWNADASDSCHFGKQRQPSHGPDWRSYRNPKGANCKPFHQASPVCS